MNHEDTAVQGMVLLAQPVGENDKRLVLLTKELGKITVFAHGARRPNSPFVAAANPFAQGRFVLGYGKTAYNLHKAEITHYFRELTMDLETLAYGSYFLELAAYVSQENLEGTGELALLFYSLKALLSEHFSNSLVRRIFELKTFVLDGAYPDISHMKLSETARYTFSFIVGAELKKLYSFHVEEGVIEELSRVLDDYMKRTIPREFPSLKLLS